MNRSARTPYVLLPALALLAGTAAAEGPVVVEGAWIPQSPPGMDMMAGYATFHNRGTGPVIVTGAASPVFGRVEFHRTVHEGGMARMKHLPRLRLEGGSRVHLEPGGLHLMLMAPRRRLAPGDEVEITFTTAGGQRVQARFTVRPRNGAHHH